MTAETSNARGEWVLVPREVFDFLMGEGELQGAWFGETPVGERGQWFWRKHLRQAAATPPPPADAEVRDDDIDDEHSCVAGGPAWQEGFNAGRATGRNEALDELRKAPPEARDVVDVLEQLVGTFDRKMSETDGGLEGSWFRWRYDTYASVVEALTAALTEARNGR
jgi:hypothetical protein